MANFRAVDMLFLDDLFSMGSGYVLNFSDRTFAHFFRDELGIDIDIPIYQADGMSKGKRLRCFLQTADKATVAKALQALWEYRQALRERDPKPDSLPNAQATIASLIARLQSPPGRPHAPDATTPALCANVT
jgi:hypothetical protein